MFRPTIAVLAALSVAACATAPPIQWEPRADANLAADTATCKEDARRVNIRSAQGYSDAEYGAAAAMAGRLDNKANSVSDAYNVIFATCMSRKGWKQKP